MSYKNGYKKLCSMLAIFLLIFLLSGNYNAAPGDLDTTFGSSGIVLTPFGLVDSEYYVGDLQTQPDGKILVSGGAQNINNETLEIISYIARYNANGTLDSSFGTNGKIIFPLGLAEYYGSFALQADGKIVVGGLRDIDATRKGALARYNSNGTLDTTFGTNGKIITLIGLSSGFGHLILQLDGKIIAAGTTHFSEGNRRVSLARYNPSGSLDTAFGDDGKLIIDSSTDDFTTSAVLQLDGKILLGGNAGNGSDFLLIRLLPNGTLDQSFGTNGKVITPITANIDFLNDLALQPDGKIIAVGGYPYNEAENQFTLLVRYNSDGSLDANFAANGILLVPLTENNYFVGSSVALQPNGKILTVGYGSNDFFGSVVARYNINGSPDHTFGTKGIVITPIGNYGVATNIALQPDGKIIVAGGTSSEVAIARYFGDETTQQRTTQFDFDGDGRSDISVFRPSSGFWYLNQSTNGFSATQFGLSTDKLTPADFDGDGRTDVAVFRDGFWYWLNSSDNSFQAAHFGQSGDVPIPDDYTGDGRAEIAVFRDGFWYSLDLSNNQFTGLQFGFGSDKPVPADYDGDGKADVAVVRQENGLSSWYIQGTTNGFYGFQFGADTDKLVPADYDGDGKTDIAVYRSGTWYLQQSTQGFTAFQWGNATDIPTPADYDGDGKTDAAVFRDGVWYLRQSSNGFSAQQFGLAIDKPIPATYLP